MLRTHALAIVLLQLFSITGVKADCYNLNGNLALNTTVYTGKTELVSCGENTHNCCLRNEQCGSNLLCKSNDGFLKRQYCDNVFWNGCSPIAPGTKSGGIVLNDCGNNVVTYGAGNCTAGPFYFVDPRDGSTTSMSISSGSTATASYWSVDTAAALASQSASSVSASLASLTAASASATAQSTATSASATSTSPPTQTPTPAGPSGLSAGAGAGIGIGAAAAIAGVAALVWLWMRERRKRKALQEPYQQPYAPATTEAYAPYPQTDSYKVAYAQHQEPEQLPPQELDGTRPRNEVP
ncbi:hypothetical protein N0V95_005096 [Ascochyta clinopodiicola]|nr:hypothetical protein N0V95_005096 [Ascochyta clinopodiicola]